MGSVCGEGGFAVQSRKALHSPPIRRPSYLTSSNSITTARWRGTTAWRGPRRSWRSTTLGRAFLGQWLHTSGAVTLVLETRWCDMLPTDCYPRSLSPLGLGAACPWIGSRICLPATTTTLSSWSWTASLRRPTSFPRLSPWQLQTWLPFSSSMWFVLTVFRTCW